MFTNQSADISLGAPCRAAGAVSIVENRWVVGTNAKYNNKLQQLQFHPHVNELAVEYSYDIDSPIQCIACSPDDPTLVMTATEQGSSVDLYKMEEENLKDKASLRPEDGFGAPIIDVKWYRDNIIMLDTNGHLTRWDVSTETATMSLDTNDESSHSPSQTAWDPHSDGDSVAVTVRNSVSILDWRTDTTVPTGICSSIKNCHRGGAVCDVDYNPNKPYTLATAGQDATCKFWDLRKAKHPILTTRGGHSHWVSCVRYNPFHDQLVLTAGTEAISNLWRLSTVSSAPLLQDTDASFSTPNVRVDWQEHRDSVSAISWGAVDAWIYLTVACDGKAILSHVPSKEKYKILL